MKINRIEGFNAPATYHARWEIEGNFDILGWNLAESFLKNPPSKLVVNLGFNEFGGMRKIQLTINDYQI